ncbi:MAG: nusG [Candidatus Berkelbacteria bacterium Gr01-1014_85]|uniref:Transcription termination/antitermination protein NusG n=1 Tax=Candidatus Berkelbacteria bacterium Gr01-1014_85 TaxID=2017150 RepID=A0A554JC68_9BACT|nr:MAG: nusG [Candidatus Berkelbacteria bacterium Gr01-1014_85]
MNDTDLKLDELVTSEAANQASDYPSEPLATEIVGEAEGSEATPVIDIEPELESETVSETDPEASDKVMDRPGSLLFGGQTGAEARAKMHLQKQEGRQGWYVIHTYAGYEDQVADSLRQRIESFNMQNFIFEVIVPKEKQIEIKNGKRKTVEKRIFPGYVMVSMIVTDESWYVVRNTPNVTGFIGTGVQPTMIGADEVSRIQRRMGIEEPKYKIEFKLDDLVKINDGPLKGFDGKILDIDDDKGKVRVSVSMFGRETPVTLDFLQVSKV